MSHRNRSKELVSINGAYEVLWSVQNTWVNLVTLKKLIWQLLQKFELGTLLRLPSGQENFQLR